MFLRRGSFSIDGVGRGKTGHLPDTYLATEGWSKGIAFVNGYNLGYYWPRLGPQMTLYVPGPVLKEGKNEVVMVELEMAPKRAPSGGLAFYLILFAMGILGFSDCFDDLKFAHPCESCSEFCGGTEFQGAAEGAG
jgi:hypothetical protein